MKNKKMKTLIAVLAAILVLSLVVLLVLIGGSKEPQSVATEPSTEAMTEPSETTLPTTESVEETTEPPVETVPDTPDLEIETPFVTLHYPGEWEELLHVEQTEGDIYTVAFFSKLEFGNVELFRISFGGDEGIGAVKTADGKTVNVSVHSADIVPGDNWTESQKNIVFTMQEAVNHVLNNLDLVEMEPAAPAVIPEDDTPSDLETPYGTLKYPARWDKYLVTKVNKKGTYSVKFSAKIDDHDAMHLFTIYFGGDEGAEAGTVKDSKGKDVTVRLSVAEHELDGSWTEDQRLILLAMQEDMNYLLANLPA